MIVQPALFKIYTDQRSRGKTSVHSRLLSRPDFNISCIEDIATNLCTVLSFAYIRIFEGHHYFCFFLIQCGWRHVFAYDGNIISNVHKQMYVIVDN